MNRYPLWKNLLVIFLTLAAAFLALPNVFLPEPAVQISQTNGEPLGDSAIERVRQVLTEKNLPSTTIYVEDGQVVAGFAPGETQVLAADELRSALGETYTVALSQAPTVPGWLRRLGLKPVPLGLDLRGGVHFMFEVDMSAAIRQRLDTYAADFTKILRDNRIRRTVAVVGQEVRITLPDPADADRAEKLIRESDRDIQIEKRNQGESVVLVARMTPEMIRARQDFAIQQNTTTLRNRVNELGVAETVVQRQGIDRIVVQLPGVRDATEAERVLGATATLEFRLVCDDANAFEAERTGRAPIGCELFRTRAGEPVLLKRRTIVTGDQLVDASQGFDQGRPAVFVRLDSRGARSMLDTTKANLRKPMAVVFVEQKRETIERDGQKIEVPRESREVINVATINGVFSNSFQITGVEATEARDLALLLRAGALAAPIFKVEERTVGPSLGQDNIDRGILAFEIGFGLVAAFMIIYYRLFGFVANLALLMNVVMVMALLALLQAALTLPGIAGIVLTIGMAVDANVLINERVREELRLGSSPQAAISAGYDRALATITDSNLTGLFAGIVLFVFGNGPIKGFAITLCLGILTSMFTAVVGTRSIINVIYGRRKHIEKLSV